LAEGPRTATLVVGTQGAEVKASHTKWQVICFSESPSSFIERNFHREDFPCRGEEFSGLGNDFLGKAEEEIGKAEDFFSLFFLSPG